MSKANATQYNKEALDQIWAQINGFGFEDTRRNQLVAAYVSIVLEHHKAISVLVEGGLIGSASALLRSQIEGAFRALWVNLIGEDHQIDQIATKDGEPFPRFKVMARLLDRSYRSQGIFANIAQHWRTFNSMTHSGMTQLGRRFDEAGMVVPNFHDEEVEELLRFSASISLLCVVPLFRCAQVPERAEALERWLDETPTKRDPSPDDRETL